MTHRPEVKVDCGPCRACCYQAVILTKQDGAGPTDNSTWNLDLALSAATKHKVLQRKADGSCYYLDAMLGCTIYENRPSLCRVFDCGNWFAQMGERIEREFILHGTEQDRKVLAEGRKRAQRRER
jgi:Fe-S-cluster containining protein